MLIAAQPTRGLDVGAIEFVHRRLVEERDEGRAVLLVSLELDEILSLSDRILVMYEGEIVGEYGPDVTEEELGVAMLGGTPGRGGGRVSEGPTVHQPPSAPLPEPGGAADSLARWHRAGGIVAPMLTAMLAFLAGGLVVLATGHNPVEVYQGIWNGTGLEWFYNVGSYEVGVPFTDRSVWFPWDTASRDGENLQQTLHPHLHADPDGARGRVRLPLRPLQHRRPGPVLRGRVSSRSGSGRRSRTRTASSTSRSRSSRRRWRAPRTRGSRGS